MLKCSYVKVILKFVNKLDFQRFGNRYKSGRMIPHKNNRKQIFKKMQNTSSKLEKHQFNIFPVMATEESDQVRSDIEKYGYDKSYPIILYQGKILDGWNRYQICEKLGVTPLFEEFDGTDLKAMEFIMRSNSRRNLTSSQRAVIAAEAQPIMEAIAAAVKKGKAEKLAGNQNASAEKQLVESIPPTDNPKRDDSKRSEVKLAKQFHTNTKYLANAREIKTNDPEVFELVKNGELSIPDVIRAKRTEAFESQKKRSDAMKIREDASKASSETELVEKKSESGGPAKGSTELTVIISQELLIKLKAFAKAQNVEMKHFDWDLDYMQVAVDLLNIGVNNPPFKYDNEVMKVFNDEIQRLDNTLVRTKNNEGIKAKKYENT
jgi:hypothetical protein